MLYQVATAAPSPADITTPVRTAFRDNARMRVLRGTVTAVDAAARRVIADGRAIAYDTLVLATGATHGYLIPEFDGALFSREWREALAQLDKAFVTVWRLAWSVSPSPDANVGATASWGAADQCLSQASRAAFLRRTTREKAAA